MPETLKYLRKKFIDDLKRTSSNPHPVEFVKSFIRFFFICLIVLLSVTFITLALYSFILKPIISAVAPSRGCCQNRMFGFGRWQKGDGGIMELRARVHRLESLYNSIQQEMFWTKNEKQYTFELPNYAVTLYHLDEPAPRYPDSKTTRYVYSLSVCNKNSPETGCILYLDQPKFYLHSDEKIKVLTVQPYSIQGVNGYIFSGNIRTDKVTLPFVLYPSKADSEYYYVFDAVIDSVEGGIEFLGDISNGLQFVLGTEESHTNLDLVLAENGDLITNVDPYQLLIRDY